MSPVEATRLIYTIMNDLLKLIGADYVFSVKSSDTFLPYFTSHGCHIESHQPRSLGAFKGMCSGESCLVSPLLPRRKCGRGQNCTARRDNSCQLSAEFTVEFKNKFPSCRLRGGLGTRGHGCTPL